MRKIGTMSRLAIGVSQDHSVRDYKLLAGVSNCKNGREYSANQRVSAGRSVLAAASLCIISKLEKRAGVVQWQYRSFPSFGRGFDSHRPLQILNKLCNSLVFHIFQNYNFRAIRERCFNQFHRNFAGIPRRHRR
jgi:hypothetical protein